MFHLYVSDYTMLIEHFALLPASLALIRSVPLEQWEQPTKVLLAMQRNIPWWIGDMVNLGEANFGDEFWQLIGEDVSLDMLQRYAGIAKAYPINERLTSLSFTHHAMAIRLSPTVRSIVLTKAEKERWDTSRLREHIQTLVAQAKYCNQADDTAGFPV